MNKCDICFKIFGNKKSLSNHRRWHDIPRFKAFQDRTRARQNKIFLGNSYGRKNEGEHNGVWKGENVGINPLHAWVKRHLPKPKLCEKCYVNKAYDLANKSGKYLRKLSDWEWLCRKCHMETDGRIRRRDKHGRFKRR